MTKIIFMTIFNYGCKGTIFRIKKTIIFIFKRKGAKILRKVRKWLMTSLIILLFHYSVNSYLCTTINEYY